MYILLVLNVVFFLEYCKITVANVCNSGLKCIVGEIRKPGIYDKHKLQALL